VTALEEGVKVVESVKLRRVKVGQSRTVPVQSPLPDGSEGRDLTRLELPVIQVTTIKQVFL
jgi:hypothetical protein